MNPRTPLRIGVLGAAQIVPMALVRPAREVPEARIDAIAARDPARARKFASKHGIGRVHESYDALLADPELDAVYNPLPNGLHCEWTVKALEAGKHVLCEKPMASNAEQAERMAAAAEKSGRVLVEAFHWRTHPLAARMLEIAESGELGAVQHVEATMCIPLPIPNNIRYRYDLGGGAMMDTGCYATSIVRHLAGAEPRVSSAAARLASPQVDRWMRAELRFPDDRTGRITCSLMAWPPLKIEAVVRGDLGTLRVINPVAPQVWHRLTVSTQGGKRKEHIPGDASYTCQLRAFVTHVRGGAAMLSDASDAVANMRVIDAVYTAAGMKPRGT